jgi:predicted MFS family arabinose efflux permease
MTIETISESEASSPSHPTWSPVFAMSLCAAVLIASEFMPVSLLSPIAHDLGLTEGQTGQSIAVSGVFAFLTSLLVTTIAGRIDRRIVMIGFSALLVISGALVAFAPNFLVLMTGRALLGIAIGGYWSMSTAVIMRLVPREAVPRALAIINGGNALASTISAPLGSFLGGLIGWRGAFFCVVPLAIAAVAWQIAALPPLPVARSSRSGQLLDLFRKPAVSIGMAAIMLLFMGQFALFTYLRPFLEGITGSDVPVLSGILLVIGITGVIGTALVGRAVRADLYQTLIWIPLLMAITAIALVLFGSSLIMSAALLAFWGLIATPAPVAWATWLTRTLPNDAEAGGALMVATIQLAITAGATAGGAAFDAGGAGVDFMGSAAILILAATTALIGYRTYLRDQP